MRKPDTYLHRPWIAFGIVSVIQICLMLFVFGDMAIHPQQHMFQNDGDELKNFFTLQGYVQGADSLGLWKYGEMNAPFGEYVYYTDNTPLLSIPLRMAHLAGIPAEHFAVGWMNVWMMFNFLLTSWLLLLLFREWKVQPVLAMLFALCLPWLHPQVQRMVFHPNLTFSWVLVGGILLLWKWYQWTSEGDRNIPWGILAPISGWIVVGGLVHLYYVPILGILMGACMFGSGLQIGIRTKNFRGLAFGWGSLLMGAILLMGLIRLTDGYYDLRPAGADGYDWAPWNASVDDFFRAYDHIPSIILPKHVWWENERNLFLGLAAIFGGIWWIIGSIGSRFSTHVFHRNLPPRAIRTGVSWLLGACALMAFVAMGSRISIESWGNFKMDNFLNPFRIVESFSESWKHFRCLSRLGWPLFWGWNFWLFVHMAYASAGPGKRWYRGGMGLMIGLMLLQTGAELSHIQERGYKENILTPSYAEQLFPQIEAEKYQAIVPVPFFHIGNEQKPYMLDEEKLTGTRAFQLSVLTGLPIVACKMSRTPLIFTQAHFTLFLDEPVHPAVDAYWQQKPFLVMYRKGLNIPVETKSPAIAVRSAYADFPNRPGLEFIGENEEFVFYQWNHPSAPLEEVDE
ncbi:hypothetical protein [Pontibacter sp. G13]|uniref:hypothetical protein n=1 Tax=Pontibacter sp. G13 TaxID=3074898 RepID=UPI00288974CA|nr:hypothetical protein [Pontibacter sp. G13]WNJ17672.1 hypothetical protein RJD25_22705 [Pontibacter sp. G13]